MCPNCGAVVNPTDSFCETCGKALAVTAKSLPGTCGLKQLVCHCPPGQSKPDEEGYCETCGIHCGAKTGVNSRVEEAPDAKLAMVSDIGRRHSTNEDIGAVARGDGNAVLIVADGVSTSINALSASQTAVKVVLEQLSLCANPGDAALTMRQAIKLAHKTIVSLPSDTGAVDADGPETTIVAALRHQSQLVIGWVGDSRAYLIDQYSEKLLTVDDSWAQMVVQAGQFTLEQALLDKQAHYVTQVLGMKDAPVDIHVVQIEMTEEKAVLLCSDGLWNYFQQVDSLANALRQGGWPVDALAVCRRLVQQANEQGGHDNITVALLLG